MEGVPHRKAVSHGQWRWCREILIALIDAEKGEWKAQALALTRGSVILRFNDLAMAIFIGKGKRRLSAL